jgi:hypothetical protein
MRSFLNATLGCALLLSWCNPTQGATAAAHVELRAFVNGSCIVADEPFYLPEQDGDSETKSVTLVAIIVGKIAEAMISRVVKASAGRVSTSAARKDTRYAAAKEMNLYRADLFPRPTLNLNAQLGCMTIVAGRFAPDSASCTAEYAPRSIDRSTMRLAESDWKSSRTDQSLANPLRRANVCMLEEPKAVYESRFEFSPDGTAYRLNNAGYRVNSLLTTPARKGQRNVFYTLEIAQPARTGENEKLSIALVDLGRVTSGTAAAPQDAGNERWQRVPELSGEARRAFEQRTRVNQEVAAEIEALQRAITRHGRMVTALEASVAGAAGSLKGGLQQELLKNRVQVVALQGELAARRAEYADLPREPLQFMPVAIEIGVTETKSAKPALLAMSQVVGRNSDFIAGATTTLLGVPKALDVAATPNPAAGLARARDAYFDALVETKTDPQADDRPLAQSRERYRAALAAMGIEATP